MLLYIFTSAYHQNLILQVKNISKLSVKNVKFVLNEENLKKKNKINTKQDHIIYRGQRKKNLHITHIHSQLIFNRQVTLYIESIKKVQVVTR